MPFSPRLGRFALFWPFLFFCVFNLRFEMADSEGAEDETNADRQRQFSCPNGGEPKWDRRSGRPVQCLPGRASSSFALCGPGFSCFFSGFNYHCCPGLPDDQQKKEEEGKWEEEEEEEEEEENKVAQSEEEEEAEQGDEDAGMKAGTVPDGNGEGPPPEGTADECPVGTLGVLDAKGQPKRCESGRGCGKEEKMICHAEKICCKRIGKEEEEGQKDGRRAKDEGKVRNGGGGGGREPEGEERAERKNNEVKSKQHGEDTEADERTEQQEGEQDLRYLEEFVGLSFSPTSLPPSPTNVPPKFQTIKGSPEDGKMEDGKVRKEGADKDYAPARKIEESENEQPESPKTLAQKYLLEQIKDGWPYNDKFYRPEGEDIILLKKRGHPSAIVHFPN